MVRLIVYLFLPILISCDKQYQELIPPPVLTDTVPVIPPKKDSFLTYLALGDSYTIGQSVLQAERFPVQTVELLKEDSIGFIDPEIIAQTGWTTGNLINRLNTKPPTLSKYDVVTLLIGVNNQYTGSSQDLYKEQFTTLLYRAIAYAGNKPKRVIVLSIPDYGVTPFAGAANKERIGLEIDAFNMINREIAIATGVQYLDITPSTRLAETDLSLLAVDRLHPSGKEYAKWAKRLVPLIIEGLRD